MSCSAADGLTVSCPWCHAGGGLEAAMLEQQLRRALYLASRSPDKRVAGAAWNAYIFLQRAACGAAASADCHAKVRLCSCAGGGVGRVWQQGLIRSCTLASPPQGEESANAAATDFLTKKKTRLQRVQMEALLRRVPALMPALLPAMLQQAAAARNEHLRLEALRLLVASLKVSSGLGQGCESSHDAAPADHG